MLHYVYLLSVWLHVIAATIWLGGMAFLVLVVVPWLRRGDRAQGAVLLRETGRRFRDVGWTCFAVLAATGTFNAYVRGVRISSFTDVRFLRSAFGGALALKIALFAIVLLVSAYHDFSLGPRATTAIAADAQGAQAERLRRSAGRLGRLNALLALALYGAAVVVVRGCGS